MRARSARLPRSRLTVAAIRIGSADGGHEGGTIVVTESDRISAAGVLFCVRRERGGVIAGERVRDMKGPPGGAWCSWCRRGVHSAEMTSLMAARAADWSTIFLAVA